MTRTRFLLLASVAAAATTACAASPETIRRSNLQHLELKAQERTASIRVYPGVDGGRLSAGDRDAVILAADAWRQRGHGPLLISRPEGTGADDAVLRATGETRALLMAAGADAADISEGPYNSGGSASAPLIVSFRTYEVAPADCPPVNEVNIAGTRVNASLPSFGCAVTANIAAMIADPSDLVGRQALAEMDITRRTSVLAKYREGVPTAAERDSNASGAISNAVN